MACSVNMPLDHMAPQPLAYRKRPLEVYARAGSQVGERRPAQSFERSVRAKIIRPHLYDRQVDSVDRNRVAYARPFKNLAGIEYKRCSIGATLYAAHASHFYYQACEDSHSYLYTRRGLCGEVTASFLFNFRPFQK
jgi:hypothetical protein